MSELLDQELNEYNETFDLFDTNGDNLIDKNELRNMMKKLGRDITEVEVDEIMKKADLDGDGFINFEEFINVMNSNTPVDENEIIKQAFQVLDVDKNGKISSLALNESLKNLGNILSEKDTEELMKKIDSNKDGFIDYEEFLKALKS